MYKMSWLSIQYYFSAWTEVVDQLIVRPTFPYMKTVQMEQKPIFDPLSLAFDYDTITTLYLPTLSPSCHTWLSLRTEDEPALCHWVIPRHWFLSGLPGTEIKGKQLGSAHRRPVGSSWAHASHVKKNNDTKTSPLTTLTRHVTLWLFSHTNSRCKLADIRVVTSFFKEWWQPYHWKRTFLWSIDQGLP